MKGGELTVWVIELHLRLTIKLARSFAVVSVLLFLALPVISRARAEASPRMGALTAAQEANFPKDMHLDAYLWNEFTTPWRNIHDTSRVRLKFTKGWYGGACLAWHQNQQLWGGELKAGCASVQVHPKLPNRTAFSSLPWREVNPRDHIEIIRSSYLTSQKTQAERFKSSFEPDFYWRKMAPIVRRLLIDGHIRMEEVDADLVKDGKISKVFAVTYLPYSACLSQDGRESTDRTFLYIDGNSSQDVAFNADQPDAQPFLFKGQLYFPGQKSLSSSPGLIIPTCEFAPAK